MNVTGFLATTLLCLVIYIAVRDSRASRKKKDQSKKRKSIRKYFTSLDLSRKIEFISKLIFAGLFLYIYFAYFPIVIAILSIPGIIIYVLILILTVATIWKVVKSSGRTQLEPLETNSLAFLGLILSFVGIARSAKFNAIYLDGTASIGNIAMLAVEYSAYLFFIFSLAFLLISDCCRLLISCGSKLSIKFHTIRNHVRKNAFPRTREWGLSVKLVMAYRAKSRWTKWLSILPMPLAFVLDVLAYFFQYICIIVFWIPLFCLIESLRLICSFILAIARRLCAFSNRRITVISFRLSIAVAMLLIVVMNRFGYITTTDATTSVLEFVASVLIIPIVLGWIQEALPNNKSTEQID